MEQQYRVILSGQLKPGWTIEKAVSALAKVMRCEIPQAQKIIESSPKKLKKLMSLQSAQMYKERLEQTGIICSIQAQDNEAEMASYAENSSAVASAAVGMALAPAAMASASQNGDSPGTAAPAAMNNNAEYEETEEDYTPDMGSAEVKKLLKNTYSLLAMTLVFSAITAFIGMSQNMENVSSIMILIVSLVLLGITYATRNSVFGLVSIFAFTGWMGYWIGPVLSFYLMLENGASIIATAAGMTAVVFFGLSAYVLLSKKDFSFMRSFLFAGLIVLIAGLVVSLLFNIPGFYLALSSIGVLIFSGYILYDTSEMIHGGETNYIMATVSLYLDVINLFLHLLRLLAAFTGED